MANASARAAADGGDLGRLVLRVALGVLMLFHGISKVTGGNAFVTSVVVKAGLPEGIAYLVYVGEVVAPLLLIVGAWTRVAALVVAINMLAAVVLVGASRLFAISNTGGYALELESMYFFAALTVAMLGAGRYSLGGVRGRWN